MLCTFGQSLAKGYVSICQCTYPLSWSLCELPPKSFTKKFLGSLGSQSANTSLSYPTSSLTHSHRSLHASSHSDVANVLTYNGLVGTREA